MIEKLTELFETTGGVILALGLGVSSTIVTTAVVVMIGDVWTFQKKAEIVSQHISIERILELAKELKK